MGPEHFYATAWAPGGGGGVGVGGDMGWMCRFFGPETADAIRRGEKVPAEDKPAVAVLFSDVVSAPSAGAADAGRARRPSS